MHKHIIDLATHQRNTSLDRINAVSALLILAIILAVSL
jgi:hypothetical protein